MTIKQKGYILHLEEMIIDFSNYGKIKTSAKDLLGIDWEDNYQKISYKETKNCISILQEQAIKLGCYDSHWAIVKGL